MSAIRSFRRFAIRSVAVLAFAVPAFTPAQAADPRCEPTHWPAPGSAEALAMAKTPWLLPRPAVPPPTTRWPDPGSPDALKMAKTPWLLPRPAVPPPTTRWPEPGSAEALKWAKTPWLVDRPGSAVTCK